MSGAEKKRIKDARPFYVVPEHVRTSGKIVQEARSSMGQGGNSTLRTVETARPFTPRDENRALFRRSSAREGRPPSAFSVTNLEFDWAPSRPTSGSQAPSLDPLDHKPVILPEGLRLTPSIPGFTSSLLPKPPSGEPPSPSNHPNSRSLKHKLERQRSRSINELVLPSTQKIQPSSSDIDQILQEQRRVQSGPKERTTPEPNEDPSDVGPRASSASGKDFPEYEIDEDQLWADTLSPLLDSIVKAKQNSDGDLCSRLGLELFEKLEKGKMFSRRNKLRASILKVCFRLLDGQDPYVLLPIIKIILGFKVGGNNLSNTCRLIFKLAKNEENDPLFQKYGLLQPLLDTLSSMSLTQSEESLVYASGTLKFLSGNTEILKEMVKQETIQLLGELMQQILDATRSRENQKSSQINNSATNAVYTNTLVQLTSTLRNLAEVPGAKSKFLDAGILKSIVSFMNYFPRDTELVLNISRILSKLTLCSDCCLYLVEWDGDAENGESLFQSSFKVISEHMQKPDLIVRVLFILGNMTSKSDDARLKLWQLSHDEAAKNSDSAPLKVLVSTFLKYVDLMRGEGMEKEGEGGEPTKVEDVLIKLVRIIANLSINEDIGTCIAADAVLVGLLVKVLEIKSGAKDMNPPDELLLNTMATINNLSYYMVDEDHRSEADQFNHLIHLSTSLRPIAYSVNEECILEAARVYGNLSQMSQVRSFMVDNSMDHLFIALLDSGNREVVFTSVGILINLMVDRENRPIIKNENGVQKLIDVLRDFGPNDWQLASMVCQVFWNLSERIRSSYDCFGNPEADDLCDILSEFLDEEAALGTTTTDEMDEETRAFLGGIWQKEFRPVATRLLHRVEAHLTDLETIPGSSYN